ncbi:hypothetical protein P5673_008714 [Acropora cervicornis]|uniref:Uncharacterized protein n=1 Tax=Acropora cervicornis TaxID=6130 RepID=A0AAD9QT91_ACRCE|nr:hypothetical protein P5673_008714 [Acropora cervicornis]
MKYSTSNFMQDRLTHEVFNFYFLKKSPNTGFAMGASNDKLVTDHLGSIDKLISKTLCDGLDVTECRLAGTSTEKPYCLIDPPQWGHIHSLSAHSTCAANTGAVATAGSSTAPNSSAMVALKMEKDKPCTHS